MSDHEYLSPDVIYSNGTIITMDEKHSMAEAVATKWDRIVAVGSTLSVKKFAGPSTHMEDLAGKTMLPGLVEPHNHLAMYGLSVLRSANLHSLPLGSITRTDELVDALRERASMTPKGEWIHGHGYNDTLLSEKRHPTRYDLDRVSTEHPIWIVHVSGHFCVANTKALEISGITKDTPLPARGHIRKDPDTLEPNGIMEEMPARSLVARLSPPPRMEQRLGAISTAARHFLKVGITSCNDAGVVFPGIGHREEIVAYQLAGAQGLLPIRTTMMIGAEFLLGSDGKSPAFLTGFGDKHLKIGPAKIIVDGSIQGYTAWLTQPYFVPFKGDRSYCGYPVTPPEKLNRLILEAHKAGLQVAAHGNGDSAFDAILEAYRLAQ